VLSGGPVSELQLVGGDADFINYPTEWCSQSSFSVQLEDR
jgi:hypothetical protein